MLDRIKHIFWWLNRLNGLNASDGSVLILTLITLMVVVSLGVSLTCITVSNYHMDQNELDYQAAYYVAEGALRHQLEHMRLIMEELYASGTYDDASSFFDTFVAEVSSVRPPVFKGDSSKRVDANIMLSDFTIRDGSMSITVQATGTVGKISRSLKSTVGIGWAASSVNPVFSYAIFASEGIEINNYGQVYGDIAVNSVLEKVIKIKNHSKINGNIYIGLGGDPGKVVDIEEKTEVTGQITEKIINGKLSQVVPPSGLEYRGDLTVNNTHSINGGGRYNKIEIKNHGKLVVNLDGDTVIRTGSLSFSNHATLELRGSGRLCIYVDDILDVKNHAAINKNGQADELILLFSGEKMMVFNHVEFKGVLYAPNADVQLENHADFAGSIVAKKTIIYNHAKLFYKNAIKDGYTMPVQYHKSVGTDEELFKFEFDGEV